MSRLIRKSNMIGEAFDPTKNDSLYANVPKDAAVNLAVIKKNNQIRDNLFCIL